MKKISAYFIVQDEENIIEYSITYPLQIMDEVVVVDGGSRDKTKEIIFNTAKKLNVLYKLKWFDKSFTTLNDQRNFSLSKCTMDYIMYIDADELFCYDELQCLKYDYINKYDLILVHSNHLYIDFWHETSRKGNWFDSYKMPRIFRKVPGLHYTDFKFKEGDHTLFINNTYFENYYKNRTKICDYNDITIKHAGHALGKLVEHKKIKFHMKYDNPEYRNLSEKELDKLAWNNNYFDPRFWEQGINPDKKGIIKFTGKHPEILKSHPLYNVRIIKD